MSKFYNTVSSALIEQMGRDEAAAKSVLEVLRRDYRNSYEQYIAEIGQLTYDDAIEEFLKRDSQECRLLEQRLETAVNNNALLKKQIETLERAQLDSFNHGNSLVGRAVTVSHALGVKNTGFVAKLKRALGRG